MKRRWRRAWQQRRLLAEAAVALMCANLTVLLRGPRLAAALGAPDTLPTIPPSARQMAVARDVGWAVELLAVRGPLRTACLGQALAARTLLRRRRVPCVLTLGLGRQTSGGLCAHAWLRAGDFTVTGGRGRGAYAPVAGFR